MDPKILQEQTEDVNFLNKLMKRKNPSCGIYKCHEGDVSGIRLCPISHIIHKNADSCCCPDDAILAAGKGLQDYLEKVRDSTNG